LARLALVSFQKLPKQHQEICYPRIENKGFELMVFNNIRHIEKLVVLNGGSELFNQKNIKGTVMRITV
jgi:hypothetical protein